MMVVDRASRSTSTSIDLVLACACGRAWALRPAGASARRPNATKAGRRVSARPPR